MAEGTEALSDCEANQLAICRVLGHLVALHIYFVFHSPRNGYTSSFCSSILLLCLSRQCLCPPIRMLLMCQALRSIILKVETTSTRNGIRQWIILIASRHRSARASPTWRPQVKVFLRRKISDSRFLWLHLLYEAEVPGSLHPHDPLTRGLILYLLLSHPQPSRRTGQASSMVLRVVAAGSLHLHRPRWIPHHRRPRARLWLKVLG